MTTGSESIRPAVEAKAKPAAERTDEDVEQLKRLFSGDGTGKDAAAAGDHHFSFDMCRHMCVFGARSMDSQELSD